MTSKKSGSVILPTRNSMRRTGTLEARAKKFGSWLVSLVGEPDDLVDLVAREIGRGAKVRVANHVEVRESREAQRLAQSTPALRDSKSRIEVGVVADRAVGRRAV